MITCQNCGKQNPDDSAFCQNCGHPLQITCPHCQTVNAAGAKFCKNCGHSLQAGAPALGSEASQEDPYRIAVSERRFVTVLFSDVVGSTAMGELLDPEEWTEIMNGVYGHLIPPIKQYGGTVARLMGDGVLALFGAPVAHEDDPYRAILAALAMLQALKPYQNETRANLLRAGISVGESDLDVRIGINTGLAIVGEVGSGESREYTAMGDAINLAARMEQTAEPGTIQIAHDTYQAVSSQIDAQTLDPLRVKGKREPVRAYRVLGLSSSGDPKHQVGRLQAPLVGRNPEMNELAGALSRLQMGHGQVICLLGEGGIGKSRLVEELATLSDDLNAHVKWYLTESYSFEGAQPYGLVQRLLRHAGGIASDDPPETVSSKIKALASNLPPEQRQKVSNALSSLFGLENVQGQVQPQGEELKRELFDSVKMLVQSWAAAEPTVLVLEDLHWTDPVSIDLVNHILTLVTEYPLFLLCVLRPYKTSPAWSLIELARDTLPQRYHEIELQPLSEQASNALAGNMLNLGELPEKVAALLAEKAAGVPYFIEEMVRDLIERGVLTSVEETHSWELALDTRKIDVPDSLEAVLVSRMDRLDSNTRGTLQLAAVIGRSFDYRVLKIISPDSERLKEHIAKLQQVGMIVELSSQPEPRYMFRHVLTQEAAYNTILFSSRRQYHRLVGQAMEEIFAGQLNEQAPRLAYHFQQAGEDEPALHYYSLAAQNAARLYANREAIEQYSKALAIASRLEDVAPTLARLYQGRGTISEVLGDFDGACDDLENALQVAQGAGDDLLLWRILLDLGNLWTSRNYDKAGAYYERALKLARELDNPEILARSLNRMGNWNANAEHPQEAIKYHREALDIIEKLDDPPGLANTLDLLGMANLLAGNYSSAHYYVDRAVTLYRQLDDRFRLASSLSTRHGGVSYHELAVAHSPEVMEAAARDVHEALQISEEIDWPAGESFALWILGLNTALYGRYGEALQQLEKGLSIATEIDHRQWMAGHEFAFGVIYCDILAGELAQEHAQRALDLAQETESQYWTNQAAGVLARACLLENDKAACQATLDIVLTPATSMDSHAKRYCWMQRAALALAEGEADLSLDIIGRLMDTSPELAGNVIPALWRLHAAALQATGAYSQAELVLSAAVERVPEDHPHRWRLYAAMGRLYERMERPHRAQEAYEKARADVSRLADSIFAEDLRENFLHRAEELLSSRQ